MTNRTLTDEQKAKVTELREQSQALFSQAHQLAEQAWAIVDPTDEEAGDAWTMVHEGLRDTLEDYPDGDTADGLWDMVEQVLQIREDEAEAEAEEAATDKEEGQ